MSDTQNTFQIQADEYLGVTDTTLGPGIVNSSLQNTKSDRFQIGYQPIAESRGIDMGATNNVPNSAYIDFNSLDFGTNDYDTRVVSVSGEAGVNGRGTLQLFANEYQIVGNAVNPTPLIKTAGDYQYVGYPLNVGTNQGRAYIMQQVLWNGSGGTNPANPVVTIQLRDPVSLTPFFGVLNVSMSSAFNGTGDVAAYAGWTIAKNAVPPTNVVECRSSEGTALAILYAEVDWNAGGYPQLKLFNKQAGSSFIYVVQGFVFSANDGF